MDSHFYLQHTYPFCVLFLEPFTSFVLGRWEKGWRPTATKKRPQGNGPKRPDQGSSYYRHWVLKLEQALEVKVLLTRQ